MTMLRGLLAQYRGWRDCRKGLHAERRLRKLEILEITSDGRDLRAIAPTKESVIDEARVRICDRCGNLRAVTPRKKRSAAS